MQSDDLQPRRSVLCVPASNTKALAKIPVLDCDCVIFDLEDAVATDMKGQARKNLADHFSDAPSDHRERMIRINALDTAFGAEDMKTVVALTPDAVLLPKVEEPEDILKIADILDEAANTNTAIWAMIETPKGILNAAAIARAGHTENARLRGFIVGLNDLRKATGVPYSENRQALYPWLMQIVLAARAYSLGVIDAVSNDFRDMSRFSGECAEGKSMGFDGKMLIHPAQIEPANAAFGPSKAEIAEAETIVEAFAQPTAIGQGAININGKMVERLHLEQAERLLAIARSIHQRNKS